MRHEGRKKRSKGSDNRVLIKEAKKDFLTDVLRPKTFGHFRYIGENVAPVDGYEKVTGKAIFFTDLDLPNMLHAGILRSPHPHARIVAIETSKAESLSGVATVITAQDLPQKKYGPQRPDRNILALDKVRFVGEEIAAVAAVDPETAMKAVSLKEVQYDPLPPN